MRVLHIVSGIPRSSGGPARSSQGLVAALECAGVETWLMTLTPGEKPWIDGIRHFYEGTEPAEAIAKIAPDIVHLHGIWDLRLHRAVGICKRWDELYVISPRGMLDPWALSVKKWKKRIAMFLYQRNDLKHAAALHATAELEAEHIRAAGFKNRIIISPNGVELPAGNLNRPNPISCPRVALFLSRLHPGKGLINLARAWAQVKPQGWVMRVVGPDSYGHKAEVLAELERLGIQHFDVPSVSKTDPHNSPTPTIISNSTNSHWEFVDMVDDVEKWNEYANADLLMHPSVSENFGITIAEGLAAGLPVICTKGTPWKDVEDCKCGWWIDQGVDALTIALGRAVSMKPPELQAMGENGRKLIESKYTWSAAAKAMIRGYEEVLNGRA